MARSLRCSCIPARYTLATISFLGVCNVYIFKAIMSVGVLQMDRDTATFRSNESSQVRSTFVSVPVASLFCYLELRLDS